jgi:hypothetical protein
MRISGSAIEGMIRFLQTVFPEFQLRGEGLSQDGSRWVHVGTPETYIALSPAKAEPEKGWTPYHGMPLAILAAQKTGMKQLQEYANL